MKNLVSLRHVLGSKPTGLGVYANQCCNWVEDYFQCLSIRSNVNCDGDSRIFLRSPYDIVLGAGRGAAIKRFLWALKTSFDSRVKNYIFYSATHHGLLVSNQIITIHDIIPLKFARQAPLQHLFYKYFLPRAALRSRGVITVSETVRQQLIQVMGLAPDSVHVVPNWIDSSRYERRSVRAALAAISGATSKPFLLVVGARYHHKNIIGILKNNSAWVDRFDLRVVSAGGGYAKKIESVVRELGLGDKVFISGYVSSEELNQLYLNCAALVYPSLEEGFGIPLLEAAVRGVPVLASDIPVHREVMLDGAIYINLSSERGWQLAFDKLSDVEYVSRLLDRAHLRALHYNPERARLALLSAIEHLAS